MFLCCLRNSKVGGFVRGGYDRRTLSDLAFPSFLFVCFSWLLHKVCGTLVPGPGIEPMSPTVKAQSLHH